MPLSDKAKSYAEALFRKEMVRLEKEREKRRQSYQRSNGEVERTWKVEEGFIRGMGRALAEAQTKGHEMDNPALSSNHIEEILGEVSSHLESAGHALMNRVRSEIRDHAVRMNRLDPTAAARLAELSRRLQRLIAQVLEEIRQELRVRMYEQDRRPGSGA